MKNRLIPIWLQWTFIAMLSWGVWGVLSKVPGDAISAEQSQALSTVGMLPMLLLWNRATFRGASKFGLLLAFAGGIVSCLGNVAYYDALARGAKVSTMVSLTALYPVVTIVLAVALLRERLNPVQLAGMLLSFIAIWLFNSEGDVSLWSPTVLDALPPIVLWGLSGFLQKVATNHLNAETAAVVYLASFVPVGIIMALREPWPEVIPATVWGPVLALGFFLAFGNFAMLAAFARGGKASIIAPLGGLYPLITVPLAVLFLREEVSRAEITGIAIALVSVVALSYERTRAVPLAS